MTARKKSSDTVCAISTPLGVSGIGIVRLSGPRTFAVLGRIFRGRGKGRVSSFGSHTVHFGRVEDGKRVVDEVLLTVMHAPHTYTGEDMAELGCHGSPVALQSVLKLAMKNGARLADPGEFTKRAFRNGRIDLAQAEAVARVIDSKTEWGLEAAVSQLQGRLSRRIEGLRGAVVSLLARLEVGLDLSKEAVAHERTAEDLEGIRGHVSELIAGAERGRIVASGIRAAIVGRPNVGKSSLLNALVDEDRAIVTRFPGTTRDAVEDTVNLRGIPLRLIDTAGIRKSPQAVEAEGVRRSVEWLSKADLVLLVLDASSPFGAEERELVRRSEERRTVLVLNKSDLKRRLDPRKLSSVRGARKLVETSALKKTGIRELEKTVYGHVWKGKAYSRDQSLIINSRHQGLLMETARRVENALKTVGSGGSLDFVVLDLRRAADALDRFLGKGVSQEELEEIFSYFCVGK